MSLLRHCRGIVKALAFGDTLLPQEVVIGVSEPQTEITVWLHGIGAPRDVTGCQTTVCTAPLTLCIALDDGQQYGSTDFQRAVLKFCERGEQSSVLGEIRLRYHATISLDNLAFILFQVRSSTNYCLPRIRLWAHYLLHTYSHWRRKDPADMRMTLSEERAANVTFIRPHLLGLVSLGKKTRGNIFPMNLMGYLGDGRFGFGLREQRLAAHLVEHVGRIAISSVPLSWCSLPFQLAGNHKKEFIDWSQLSFETKLSMTFGIPVPVFATRVRELEIEKVRQIGSHRFFIARLVSDETYGEGPQTFVVHGFYQCWRLKRIQKDINRIVC